MTCDNTLPPATSGAPTPGELALPERASEIAHELRTQLAIVSLRLASIDDPRAKEAEHDIHALSATVDELSWVISHARGQLA